MTTNTRAATTIWDECTRVRLLLTRSLERTAAGKTGRRYSLHLQK